MMKTGSIYVRLSAAAGDTNLSRDGMVAECRALAQREGIHVPESQIHVDDGISGAVRDRPEFTAWLNDAREGRANVLIGNHSDRLTREGVNAAALVLDVVEGKDPTSGAVVRPPVRLTTVDGLDSEKDAESFRWRFVIAAEVARGERENIKRRNKANRARLREAGRHEGGQAPYGCKVVERSIGSGKVGKFLEREDTEAGHLEHVAQMLIAGKPTMAALRWLDQQGIRTRRGNVWTSRSLRITLASEATKTHVFAEDPATWLALQRRLTPGPDPRKRIGVGRPATWLLSRGNARCGKCGTKLVVGSRHGRTRYACTGQSAAICPGLSIWADEADAFIEAEYLSRYADAPVVAIVTRWPGQDELSAAVKARDEALRALRAPRPTREAFEAYEAAQQAVEHWEEVVRASEPQATLAVEDDTLGDRWHAASREDRWHIVHEALHEPILVMPGSHGGPRNRGVDTRRIVATWDIDVPTLTEHDA